MSVDDENEESQESDLESLVRTLSEDSIDQEMRNLLVMKASFLSDFMKSSIEMAKQPVLQSSAAATAELVHTMHAAMETIVTETTILLKQFDEAIEEARGMKAAPSVKEMMAFLEEGAEGGAMLPGSTED